MFKLINQTKLSAWFAAVLMACTLNTPAFAELTAADMAATPPGAAPVVPKADAPLLGDTPAAGLPVGTPSHTKAVKKGKHGKVIAKGGKHLAKGKALKSRPSAAKGKKAVKAAAHKPTKGTKAVKKHKK